MPRNGAMPPYANLTPEQQQHMVYQQYIQQQQQGVGGNYPMPPQVSHCNHCRAIQGLRSTIITCSAVIALKPVELNGVLRACDVMCATLFGIRNSENTTGFMGGRWLPAIFHLLNKVMSSLDPPHDARLFIPTKTRCAQGVENGDKSGMCSTNGEQDVRNLEDLGAREEKLDSRNEYNGKARFKE